jgi:UDP-N-acetylglucosamine acyltransferase
MRNDVNRSISLPESQSTFIHPQALVAEGAEIGPGCVIGPRAVIGPQVKLGRNVQVGPGAIIEGRTSIGDETRIFAYATIGSIPQDLKYKGEDAEVVIGSRNAIREYVNISIGTEGGGSITRIGDDNLIMVYTHIAHDCIIGNHCIFANSVQIAGHVEIADGVVFGGMSGAHQFTRFGDLAMVGAAAVVVQDVPPFCMVQGDRAQINGLNVVGLRRKGLSSELFSQIKTMYRLVYSENLTVEDALSAIESKVSDSDYRRKFVDFLRKSTRGICR